MQLVGDKMYPPGFSREPNLREGTHNEWVSRLFVVTKDTMWSWVGAHISEGEKMKENDFLGRKKLAY